MTTKKKERINCLYGREDGDAVAAKEKKRATPQAGERSVQDRRKRGEKGNATDKKENLSTGEERAWKRAEKVYGGVTKKIRGTVFGRKGTVKRDVQLGGRAGAK